MHHTSMGAPPILYYWTEWSLKLFSLLALLSLSVFFDLSLSTLLLLCLSFIAIFMLTALRNLLTTFLPPSHSLAELDFPLLLTPLQYKPLMQESTSIFIPSSLSLASSETAFLCLCFLLPMICSTLRERYHDTLLLGHGQGHCQLFLLQGEWGRGG